MSNERSSLLSSQRHPRHLRRDRDAHCQIPSQDLNGSSKGKRRWQKHNLQTNYFVEGSFKDEDLIQLEEETTVQQPHSTIGSAPSSASASTLQARMQRRAMNNAVFINQQAIFDDDDSDEDEVEIRKGAADEELLDLNMEPSQTYHYPDEEPTPTPILMTPPTSPPVKKVVMNEPFGQLDEFQNIIQNSVQKDMSKSKKLIPRSVNNDPLSPPRPFKQPIRHAKKAVSTLFGSSVILDNEKQKNRIHQKSLLDTISQTSNGADPVGSFAEYKDGKKQQVDFISNFQGKSSEMKVTRPLEPSIDIGDPFSYSAQATMNQRRMQNKQRNNASSVANSWFGDSLNYTTTFMDLRPSRKNDDEFIQEHQLLDRLHEAGANQNSTLTAAGLDLISKLNHLDSALLLSYGLTTAASTIPITLIPTIAMDLLKQGRNNGDDEDGANSLEAIATVFASTVAANAVLGTAAGKFLNGPLGDIFGARRVACLYAFLLCLALTALSCGNSERGIILCCAAVEFFQSVQWPCTTIILAAHYGNTLANDEGNSGKTSPSNLGPSNDASSASIDKYERGVYIVSVGSRCGSLLATISTSLLLRVSQDSWRAITRLAAMSSFCGCLSLYFFVTDSPGKVHEPQNPIKGSYLEFSRRQTYKGRAMTTSTEDIVERLRYYFIAFLRNVLPSLRSVLSNGTFWVVAVAHSGGLMVCTSVRILGTYFRDTSYGAISENEAGVVTIFLSVGVLVGLALGGNVFANLSYNSQARKKMVASLYIIAVSMCYALAFLAIPFVRKALHSSTIVAFLQAAASFGAGAGVAVQVYCIPAIVGCTFGANKGLYASYTDGVACIVSSLVWRIVGNAVQEGNPQGSGWAYGWAAVALLVILAGLLMVEFVEYYFCRGGWRGRVRDANNESSTKNIGGASLNSSFAESGKRLWENRPAILRPAAAFKNGPEIESILSVADDDDDDDASTIEFEDITLPIDYHDIESDLLSQNPSDIKQQVLDLLDLKGNDICVDCQAPFPRWISIILPTQLGLNHRGASKPLKNQIGCVCCTQCAGSHRKLGNHVVRVRSVDYDSFKSGEVLALRRGGNIKVNRIYEALLQDMMAKPSPSTPASQRERFISAKYEKKMWYKFPDDIPLNVETSFDHNSSLASIELVPHHGMNSGNDKPSFTTTVAHFDRQTHDQYESFVRQNDSDSEFSGYNLHAHIQPDDKSVWSDRSYTGKRGLENLVHL